MRAEALEIVLASDRIPLGTRSAPSRSLTGPPLSWVAFLSLRPAFSPRAHARVARRRRARRPRTGRILRRWRGIEVAQENICGAAVAPRTRLGPALASGNIFVVLTGLLEHAMLPAEISRSGLKSLLLYGVRLMPGHFCRRYIRFAGCARSFRTELIWVDIAETSRFCSMLEVNISFRKICDDWHRQLDIRVFEVWNNTLR